MRSKFCVMLIAIMACVETMVAEPITVGLTIPLNADPYNLEYEVFLWAWTSEGDIFESWPGEKCYYNTEVITINEEDKKFYTYTFDESVQDVNIVWCIYFEMRVSGTSHYELKATAQSADIKHITSSTYFDYEWNWKDGVGSWLTVQPVYTKKYPFYYALNDAQSTANVLRCYDNYYLGVADNDDGDQESIVIPSFISQCDKKYDVTYIMPNAFEACEIRSITIPNSITNIGENAFRYCRNLTSVTCLGTTPPSAMKYRGEDLGYRYYNPFDEDSLPSMTLYVPAESLTAYMSHYVWGWFGHIYPTAETCPDLSNCELELVGTVIAPQANATADESTWSWGNVYPMGKKQKEGVVYTWRAHKVKLYRHDYRTSVPYDPYENDKEFKIRTKNAMPSGGINYFDYGEDGMFGNSNLYVEDNDDYITDADYYGITFTYNVQTGEIAYSCVVSNIPPINYYTIRFVNYDGSELLTLTDVEEGTVPVYTGPTPTRPADAQYTYSFKSWNPEIVAAFADATYKAQFNATEKPVNTCEDVHATWLQTGGSGLGEMSTDNSSVWTYNAQYGAFGKKQGGGTGFLLTPAKDLSGMKTVTLSFSHTHRYAQNTSEELTLWVCADYKGDVSSSSWQKLTISPYASNNNWTFVNVSLNVPLDKVGENTVFGFKYVSTSSNYSTWEIKNLQLDAICGEVMTDIEIHPAKTSDSAHKVLINNQIFILRGDKIYTIQGQVVK